MLLRKLYIAAALIIFTQNSYALEVVYVDGMSGSPTRTESILGFFSSGVKIVDGTLRKSVSAECHPQNLQKLTNSEDIRDFQQRAEKYFNKCQHQLRRNGGSGILALGDLEKLKYDLNKNVSITKHRFIYDNGESTEGLLALKNSESPRPLVIIKCGLFCTGVDGPTVKEMMIHFADQSPFHILYLGNHSGINNVLDNRRLTFGGYYEAHEVLAIAKWFSEVSPIRSRINRLHMMGISLGGSSAFYTALYNDMTADQTGKKYISSVLAFCPVVDLESSITKVYQNVVGISTAGRTWDSIRRAYPTVPDLHGLVDLSRKPKKKHYKNIMGTAAFRHVSRIPQSELLPEFPEQGVNELADFWEANQFLDHYHKVKTPVFVWASKDDPVVKYLNNAGRLRGKLLNEKPNENIQVLTVKKGSHCAFTSSYGWPTTTHLLSSYFQLMSPELHPETIELRYNYPKPRIGFSTRHTDQKWEIIPGKRYAELTFRAYSRRYTGCRYFNVFRRTADHCFIESTVKIPVKDLLNSLDLKAPRNKTEAQMLTRWLNYSSTIVDSKGQPLRDSRKRPHKIIFKKYN